MVSAPTDKRFRRAHVSPAHKRSRLAVSRTRVAVVGVLTAVLLFAGHRAFEFVTTAEALTVTRITVSGNTRLSRGEVLSLLDGLAGRNMLFVGLDEWRQRVLLSPWVEDAALRRVLPGTVDVVIAERQPMGIGRIAGGLYLLDEHGGIIDEFGPNHAEFDLPLIDGLSTTTRSPAGDPVVDEGRAALAARVVSSLQGRPELASRVSQIDVSDVRDAVIILKNDTVLIRIGDDQFAERLQSYLDLASALREKVPRIDYVDLRFGERIYVRPQAGSLKASGYR
jgi:cell division septal protein FtsQ